MQSTLLLLSIVAIASVSALPFPQNNIQIVRQNSDTNPDGSFQYSYETSDGSKQDVRGELENVGGPEPALKIIGSFSYIGDDGQTYTVNYVADSNGFQPVGNHLPSIGGGAGQPTGPRRPAASPGIAPYSLFGSITDAAGRAK